MKTFQMDTHIPGCRNGDRKSQEFVYKYFSGKMLAVCRRYTDNTMEAEDILQEGFIKVFTSIGSYKGEGSFEGWIRRIIVNTALTAYRQKKRQVLTTDIDQCSYALYNYADTANNDTEYLYRSLNCLPRNQKVSFNLFAIEGYTHQEIAALTGMSVLQSRSNVFRARAALRASISKGHMLAKHKLLGMTA